MIHVRMTETLPGGRVRFTLEADAPGLLAIFGIVRNELDRWAPVAQLALGFEKWPER